MEFLLAKLFGKLALPPGVNILLGFAGLLIHRSLPRTGFALLLLAVLSLYLFSTPLVSGRLIKGLERYQAVRPADLMGKVDVIVVLGGAVYRDAPEYRADSVSPSTLARLRYTAYLHRTTGLPVLVSGGSSRRLTAVGRVMADILETDFNTPVQWLETDSRNTRENAEMSRTILHAAGITRIALVTHALHMPRALRAFELQGLNVVPAPTEFYTHGEPRWSSLLVPQMFALEAAQMALHEYVGAAWYWLRE